MKADVQETLNRLGVPNWPLDTEGLPIATCVDETPTGTNVCHSMTGSRARHMILFGRKWALMAFDPVI